ncbi:MAG TPA: bifunctional DNA-binding transcriptional regulator/O6-methylguanine-DNA methyltransferase Ada [Thermomicrobiales bacterium]|nr:bifunctional DNA-binding transcriptional regulator/O6-methylguanine-DNA methyltransferase Ada [Thermomicrobiales bacterium]
MMNTTRPIVKPIATDDEARWQALVDQNPLFDGTFVVAVKTTHIYCRPICPARRPYRQNVTFYDTPDDAEAAGFRACLRCHPRDERPPAAAMVERACAYLTANLDRTVTLAELGKAVGLSPYYLQRTFTGITGVSPRAWADARRLETLKTQLRGGDDVTTALYDAGYGSSSRLYERAPGQLGMTPGTYRRGGQGMRIGWSIRNCALGRILVAATERGVSAIYIGDDDGTLEDALRHEYPAAEIERDDDRIGGWMDRVLDHVAGRRESLDLPLDVVGTAFQRRVWEALRTIPLGSTRSYAEVANSIGEPRAVRAVAQACAKNPTAITVPCHRVVRSDGSLSGYRWGAERKQALLDRERDLASVED